MNQEINKTRNFVEKKKKFRREEKDENRKNEKKAHSYLAKVSTSENKMRFQNLRLWPYWLTSAVKLLYKESVCLGTGNQWFFA